MPERERVNGRAVLAQLVRSLQGVVRKRAPKANTVHQCHRAFQRPISLLPCPRRSSSAYSFYQVIPLGFRMSLKDQISHENHLVPTL